MISPQNDEGQPWYQDIIIFFLRMRAGEGMEGGGGTGEAYAYLHLNIKIPTHMHMPECILKYVPGQMNIVW